MTLFNIPANRIWTAEKLIREYILSLAEHDVQRYWIVAGDVDYVADVVDDTKLFNLYTPEEMDSPPKEPWIAVSRYTPTKYRDVVRLKDLSPWNLAVAPRPIPSEYTFIMDNEYRIALSSMFTVSDAKKISGVYPDRESWRRAWSKALGLYGFERTVFRYLGYSDPVAGFTHLYMSIDSVPYDIFDDVVSLTYRLYSGVLGSRADLISGLIQQLIRTRGYPDCFGQGFVKNPNVNFKALNFLSRTSFGYVPGLKVCDKYNPWFTMYFPYPYVARAVDELLTRNVCLSRKYVIHYMLRWFSKREIRERTGVYPNNHDIINALEVMT